MNKNLPGGKTQLSLIELIILNLNKRLPYMY